jgi:hypothetical protein
VSGCAEGTKGTGAKEKNEKGTQLFDAGTRCVPFVSSGRPFGDEQWSDRVVHRLGIEITIRPRGRPRKGSCHFLLFLFLFCNRDDQRGFRAAGYEDACKLLGVEAWVKGPNARRSRSPVSGPIGLASESRSEASDLPTRTDSATGTSRPPLDRRIAFRSVAGIRTRR